MTQARMPSRASSAPLPRTHGIPDRPMVVLAGWLGCQERSLRRYASMYESLGFSVLPRIASPTAVVSASQKIDSSHIPQHVLQIQHKNMMKSRYEEEKAMGMNDLAWDILLALHSVDCSVWIFHGFSNAGCFLWEHIRNILKPPNERKIFEKITTDLRNKLVGVIFDSGPAQYNSEGTALAMQYCSWRELAVYYARTLLETTSTSDKKQRETQFWLGMRNDPWNVPQLYLYSVSDELTRYKPLEALVSHRKGFIGPGTIFSRKWESSSHCRHLLEHPNDYRLTVETFIDHCLFTERGDGAAPTSRL